MGIDEAMRGADHALLSAAEGERDLEPPHRVAGLWFGYEDDCDNPRARLAGWSVAVAFSLGVWIVLLLFIWH